VASKFYHPAPGFDPAQTLPSDRNVKENTLPDWRIFMTTIKGIVALLLATAAALASAETVYKYERPDGTLIYSDSPVRGAKLIGQFELVPSPPSPSFARGNSPRSAPTEDLAERRAQALDEADARIKAADRALKNAEERQQRVVEPLPGERLGNVGGTTSRLTPAYFARQRAAAAAVDAARAELDRAYRLRNEVRE
jgi:hypothetical protein